MLATIKISPTFKDYFNDLKYQVDVNSYYDIEFYLRSMHINFSNYIKQIQNGQSQEGFTYLDKDLKIVDPQSFPMKKIKNGDTIYIAPIVCGGGGKKGMIFAMIAVAVIAPYAVGAMAGGTTGFAATWGAGLKSMIGAVAGLPSFVQGILGNLALAAIGALLTSKPKAKQTEVTKDSGTRTENNMFGSLTNTTTSGTPVNLNYGTMRVSGQFLSGYVLSTEHGQDNSPSIESIFIADATPLATPTPNDD